MAWRHLAEQALTDIADEEGDDSLRVMASVEGDVDVTMVATARIEVESSGSISWLWACRSSAPTHRARSNCHMMAWTCCVRLLGAIQASVGRKRRYSRPA